MKGWLWFGGFAVVGGLVIWGTYVEPFRPWCAALVMSMSVVHIMKAWKQRREGWFHVSRVNGVIQSSAFYSVMVAFMTVALGLARLTQNDAVFRSGVLPAFIAFVVDRWNLKRKSPTPGASWLF